MANLRQSILIRTDLNLPVGLLAAQVAHLHFETFRRRGTGDSAGLPMVMTRQEGEWAHDPYLFVHQVPNLEALDFFEHEAKKADINTESWRDTIFLQLSPTFRKAFENVKVGIVLGPDDSDKIKAVISDLPLL